MLNLSDILRGYTDTVVLAQLACGDSYGYGINRRVHEATGGAVSLKEATLYQTFRRLEGAGLIESYWGDENAGARRRYYHLTEKGRSTCDENRRDYQRYDDTIRKLIGMEERHEQADPQLD